MPHIDDPPPGCAPVKILLAGDSLMKQSAQAIIDRFHEAGYPVEALVDAHGGANVVEYAQLDPDNYPSTRAELQHHLDSFQPDIVLANWGINKVDSMWGGEFSFLTPWVVQNSMQDVVEMVLISGALLYWTTIPWRADDFALATYANEVNSLILSTGVPLVDWREAVSDDSGTYAQYLQYPEDGVVHQVRLDDGIHFTPDGVDRVATWTVATLASVSCGS